MKIDILLINICKEKLHYYEFVRPIEDILLKRDIKFLTKGYKSIRTTDLDKSDKVIICGTSLFDNEFIKNIDKFNWLKNFNKPLLGICGGMQIIGIIFEGDIKKRMETGYYYEFFYKNFLGLEDNCKVYHLHNYYIDFSKLDFEVFAGRYIAQAVKHKKKDIYGTLFHPEVRQKELIRQFSLL